MADEETTTTSRASQYTVQQEVQLYEQTTDEETGEPSYAPVTAWIDVGESAGVNRRAAIKQVKNAQEIVQGRFRGLTVASAEVHESRTETKTREVWG